MDVYTVFKFFHIAVAIAWLGGALAMVLLGILAERAHDDGRLLTVIDQIVLIAHRIFVPGTGLVLLFGLLMVWTAGYAWGEAWIVLGFVGILVTGGLGARVLTPLAEQVTAISATPSQRPEALAAAHRLLAIAKFDLVMLFTIVLLMVVKPGWSDWPVLLVVAAVLALAGLVFLRPTRRLPVAA
jgi:uncharacterized membrane protein